MGNTYPKQNVVLYDAFGNQVTVEEIGGKWCIDVNVVNGGGGGGGTSSAFGAAFPADGTAIGIERAGLMQPIVEGQAVSAQSVPVVIASDQTPIPVTTTPNAATTTTAQISVGASAVTLLAANANRVWARIKMGGTAAACLYLLGTSAISTSNYTDSLPACGSANDGSSPLIVITGYVGIIKAILASGSSPVLVNVTEGTNP